MGGLAAAVVQPACTCRAGGVARPGAAPAMQATWRDVTATDCGAAHTTAQQLQPLLRSCAPSEPATHRPPARPPASALPSRRRGSQLTRARPAAPSPTPRIGALCCSAGELSAEELESIMTIVANPRAYKIPDWFLNRQKDVKDGRYSQARRGCLTAGALLLLG